MKYIIYIITLIVISSCSKVIDMDIDSKPPKLVINAWLRPDSLIKVHISQSMHILENGEKPILVKNAKVYLFENNIKIETLHYASNGFYASDYFFPKAGNHYRIDVYSEEIGSASAECSIPDTIQINNIEITKSTNNLKQSINTLTINFTDNKNEANYYMIYFEYKNRDTLPEKYYYNTKILFSTNNPYTELSGNWSLLGYFYQVENEMGIIANNALFANVIAFSDNLFNGISAKIDLTLEPSNPNMPVYKSDNNSNDIFINFVSISKDYYNYISSYHGDESDPFTEREQTWCNVKNGYGILLSSNQNKRVVKLSGK